MPVASKKGVYGADYDKMLFGTGACTTQPSSGGCCSHGSPMRRRSSRLRLRAFHSSTPVKGVHTELSNCHVPPVTVCAHRACCSCMQAPASSRPPAVGAYRWASLLENDVSGSILPRRAVAGESVILTTLCLYVLSSTPQQSDLCTGCSPTRMREWCGNSLAARACAGLFAPDPCGGAQDAVRPVPEPVPRAHSAAGRHHRPESHPGVHRAGRALSSLSRFKPHAGGTVIARDLAVCMLAAP